MALEWGIFLHWEVMSQNIRAEHIPAERPLPSAAEWLLSAKSGHSQPTANAKSSSSR
jgi:hypothetical protein